MTLDSKWDKVPVVDANEVNKARALLSGSDGMRDIGKQYLRQLKSETPKDFQARLERTTLYPGLERALEDMVGRALGREVILPEGDAFWEEWAKEVDQYKTPLSTWARDAFREAMTTGVVFAIPDAPQRTEEENREQAMERKPWLQLVYADHVINYETLGDSAQLTAFRIQIGEDRRREYLLLNGRVGVFDYVKRSQPSIDKSDEWVQVGPPYFYPPVITEIPVVPLYTNPHGFMYAVPPLRHIADQNLKHYNLDSDLENIVTFVSSPLMTGTGVPEDFDSVVPNELILLKDPGAEIKYVEPNGSGVAILQGLTKETIEVMDRLGIAIVSERLYMTATETENDRAREVTRLTLYSQHFQLGLNRLMRLVGLLASIEWPDEGVQLSIDITRPVNTTETNRLYLDMYKDGVLDDPEDVLELYRLNGTIPENFERTEVEREDEPDMEGLVNAAISRATSGQANGGVIQPTPPPSNP